MQYQRNYRVELIKKRLILPMLMELYCLLSCNSEPPPLTQYPTPYDPIDAAPHVGTRFPDIAAHIDKIPSNNYLP